MLAPDVLAPARCWRAPRWSSTAVLSLAALAACAHSASASVAPEAKERVTVSITGTCGESGLVGEVTRAGDSARFRSCLADGIAVATFMDSAGGVLAEHVLVVSGERADELRIGTVEFSPDGDMPEAAQKRLLELRSAPSRELLAALPDALSEIGVCEQRPHVAALLGLAFLFQDQE